MPGSSTTPGRVDARFHAPTRVAFRIRNGVGTRDKNLYEAQWLACVLLYRRFAAALTGVCARLEADVVSYSFIVSDLHRLLVAGLPAHCERFCTLSGSHPHLASGLAARPEKREYSRQFGSHPGNPGINTGHKQRPLVHPCWTAGAATS